MGDGMGPGFSAPVVILSGLAWLLITVGAVLLIIWAVRVLAGLRSPQLAQAQIQTVAVESPLDILTRRFASGEISADEFERGRELLACAPRA